MTPATAAARRATARTAARRRQANRATAARTRTRPRRSPAPSRRRQITPATGLLIPAAAVGRTAVAVSGLADSGLIHRLTRGRLWIAVLAALLAGIVALNVGSLSLGASGGRAATQAEALARENSALRARLSKLLASDRVQALAAQAGLIVPEPGAIGYLRTTDGDAERAAERIRGGELGLASAVLSPPVTSTSEPVAPSPPEAAIAPPPAPQAEALPADQPEAATTWPTPAADATPTAGGGVAP